MQPHTFVIAGLDPAIHHSVSRCSRTDGPPGQAPGVTSGEWISSSPRTSARSRALRGTFARGEMMPKAREWDENETFPVETLREAAALGFGGIYVKDDVGGSALTRLDATIIFEELAQGCTSTAAYISIHNMSAWMIDAFGGEAQRKKFLPKLCTMEHFASYCLTEPDSGRDAASLKTTREARRRPLRAQRQQGLHLRRRRFRHLCLHGAHRRGGTRKASPASWSRRARPACRIGAQEKKLGWKSQPTAMVMFENCRVPVGEPDRQGRRGLQDRDGRARRRAAQHRGLLDRRRAVLPRPHHRIHARAKAVRLEAVRLPGAALPRRRLRDRARGRAADGAPRRGRGRQPRAGRHAACRDGEASRHGRQASRW